MMIKTQIAAIATITALSSSVLVGVSAPASAQETQQPVAQTWHLSYPVAEYVYGGSVTIDPEWVSTDRLPLIEKKGVPEGAVFSLEIIDEYSAAAAQASIDPASGRVTLAFDPSETRSPLFHARVTVTVNGETSSTIMWAHGDLNPDGDWLLNMWDPDVDGDGVNNADELAANLNPFRVDTDSDGIPDGAEDEDSDGKTNSEESYVPLLSESEGGGKTEPTSGNPDGDGMPNEWDTDADGDGVNNSDEIARATDPLVADDPSIDTDGDGLTDVEESIVVEMGYAPDVSGDEIADPPLSDRNDDGLADVFDELGGLTQADFTSIDNIATEVRLGEAFSVQPVLTPKKFFISPNFEVADSHGFSVDPATGEVTGTMPMDAVDPIVLSMTATYGDGSIDTFSATVKPRSPYADAVVIAEKAQLVASGIEVTTLPPKVQFIDGTSEWLKDSSRPFTFSLADAPASVRLNEIGQAVFTPMAEDVGTTMTFVVRATDGEFTFDFPYTFNVDAHTQAERSPAWVNPVAVVPAGATALVGAVENMPEGTSLDLVDGSVAVSLDTNGGIIVETQGMKPETQSVFPVRVCYRDTSCSTVMQAVVRATKEVNVVEDTSIPRVHFQQAEGYGSATLVGETPRSIEPIAQVGVSTTVNADRTGLTMKTSSGVKESAGIVPVEITFADGLREEHFVLSAAPTEGSLYDAVEVAISENTTVMWPSYPYPSGTSFAMVNSPASGITVGEFGELVLDNPKEFLAQGPQTVLVTATLPDGSSQVRAVEFSASASDSSLAEKSSIRWILDPQVNAVSSVATVGEEVVWVPQLFNGTESMPTHFELMSNPYVGPVSVDPHTGYLTFTPSVEDADSNKPIVIEATFSDGSAASYKANIRVAKAAADSDSAVAWAQEIAATKLTGYPGSTVTLSLPSDVTVSGLPDWWTQSGTQLAGVIPVEQEQGTQSWVGTAQYGDGSVREFTISVAVEGTQATHSALSYAAQDDPLVYTPSTVENVKSFGLEDSPTGPLTVTTDAASVAIPSGDRVGLKIDPETGVVTIVPPKTDSPVNFDIRVRVEYTDDSVGFVTVPIAVPALTQTGEAQTEDSDLPETSDKPQDQGNVSSGIDNVGLIVASVLLVLATLGLVAGIANLLQ